VIVAVGTGGGGPGWQTSEAESERRDYYERLNNQLVSLTERVARLEEDNWWLKRELRWLKRELKKVKRRTRWWIIRFIITILLELLNILSRHPVAH